MNKQTKRKIIFSKRIMIQLLELGYEPVATMPNPTEPKLLCWAFEWTPEFDEALSIVLSGGGRNA